MIHKRKSRNAYRRFPAPESCDFCNPVEMQSRMLRETEFAYVVPNRVRYDFWDTQGVVEHLMVIPKRHVHSLSELPNKDALGVFRLIAEYESSDYNIYARAVRSSARSVPHQHTHLIKLNHKPAKFFLFFRKPYFLIKF